MLARFQIRFAPNLPNTISFFFFASSRVFQLFLFLSLSLSRTKKISNTDNNDNKKYKHSKLFILRSS
jgi:hypothetical protein